MSREHVFYICLMNISRRFKMGIFSSSLTPARKHLKFVLLLLLLLYRITNWILYAISLIAEKDGKICGNMNGWNIQISIFRINVYFFQIE